MADSDKPIRKIIHVDMDAFYASVEQRDNPDLRGKPVAVGGGHRGVVTAASYEARPFGVRSAMPSVTAKRKCPELIFVKPRFDVYREVSRQIRAIFAEYADEVEPLSLDEAYLDVTADRQGLGTARATAEEIRRRIREETSLTASAGVSYCKFVAKLASDQNKPDGLCVITPERAQAYIAALPVSRFHGIGPVTARQLEALGIHTGADLQERSLAELEMRFGSSGGLVLAHLPRDRRARGEVRPSLQVSQRGAHVRRGSARPRAAFGRADADRGLCLGPHRARRSGRANGHAEGQVRATSRSSPGRRASEPRWPARQFDAAGQALLAALHPLPKGIRLLGLGLHNLTEGDAEPPRQLGLAI